VSCGKGTRPGVAGQGEFAPTLRILVVSLALAVAQAVPLAGQQGAAQENFQQLAQQAAEAQRQGQGEQAIRLYLKALRIRPKWPDGWRNVGMLLADRKEYARAEAAFRNLVDVEPKNADGWALLGLAEYEQGRYDDAFAHIQHGRTLGMTNADLYNVATFNAALIMIQKGEFEVAQELLVRVARSGVEDSDLTNAFGLAALRIRAGLDKLETQQKSLVARVGQIGYQATHSPVPETIAAYRKLLAEVPPAPGLHYAFGNFLINVAHYQEGIEELHKELELRPDDVMTLLQIAMTYLKINQPDRALPYAEKALRLSPGFFAAHYALGWTLFKLGENERAIAELEQVVQREPNSPQAHFALSQAYLRAHRKADADRERELFAKLKQRGLGPGAPPGAREYSGTPAENLPLRPEE
jgi:tetratricopeptide (TPR) repeat protein